MIDGHGDQVTLKEFINTLFKASNDRMDAYWLAHNAEHERLSEQLERDTKNLSYRLEGMNELRAQVQQERGNFATRDMLDARTSSIQERIEEVSRRLSDSERLRANLDGRFTMLGFALFGASVILNIAVSIITNLFLKR